MMPTFGSGLTRVALPILVLGLIGCAAPRASSPVAAAEPSASYVPAPSSVPSATPAPSDDGAGIATPPPARLNVDGGDPVPGQLGTYTWADGGSDSPWLPGAPITAGTGETLSVTLPPDVVLSGWSAVLAPAANTGGEGAIQVGSGPAAMDVVAPAAGAWTLAVTIEFGDLGRATYFWLLEIV